MALYQKKSCFTNLLESLEARTVAVDLGYGVDVIYLIIVRHLTLCHLLDLLSYKELWNKWQSPFVVEKLLFWPFTEGIVVFADDTKIFSIITSECDVIELQRNLHKPRNGL